VQLRVLNDSESATAALGRTDPDGRAVLALDVSDYHVVPQLTGYVFGSVPQLISVTATGGCDTIWGSRFDPGNPQAASLCRVYGYVQSLAGAGLGEVVVTARINKSPLFYGGDIVSPYAVSTNTDSTGYWYLDLIPSRDLRPDDSKYDLTFYYASGTIMRKQVSVPDSVSFRLK
jgi:hypothetical protein